MRRGMLFLCASLLSLGIYSCDDGNDNQTVEDTSAPQDNVQPQDTVTPDEDLVEQDLAGEDVPEQDTAGTDITLTGACTSESDQAVLESDREGVSAKARECGLGCLNAEDKVACSVPCITETYAISDGCAGCYAGVIVCTVERCLTDCIADATSQKCVDCQETQGCMDEFYTCSGMIPEV